MAVSGSVSGLKGIGEDLVDRARDSAGERRLDEDDRLFGHGSMVEGEGTPILTEPIPHLLEPRHGMHHVVPLEEVDLPVGRVLRDLLQE